MISVVILVPVALLLYLFYNRYQGLQKNIATAKASGLPYVVAPIHLYNHVWLLTHKFWLGYVIPYLPNSWTESWVAYASPNWVWELGFEGFERQGFDTFMIVSPTDILIYVATPEIIHQMGTKRDSFPKATEQYKILDLFGKSLVSLEGNDWKRHRKITSPSFTEKNNALVFKEAILQCQAMIRKWRDTPGKTIRSLPEDAMRSALHIISMTGFGVKLLWPGEEAKEENMIGGLDYGSSEPPKGHTMSYARALNSLLDNLVWVILFPKWLLKWSPSKVMNEANEAYENWTAFMNELFQHKVEQARSGHRVEGMDLLGSLVRSCYGSDVEKAQSRPLSDSEILGNAFVMIVAGHETTANSIHFTTVLLALNPGSQRRIQEEVQRLVGDTDPSTWDYEKNINELLGGYVGAVLNEELRIFAPVVAIPKAVSPRADVPVTARGKTYVLPKDARMYMVSSSVHRNPGYWPSAGPSKITNKDNDLDDFVPERWLKKGTETPVESEPEESTFGESIGSSTASTLFRPAPGSFIAFSEGARSCIGRRLAQVEIVAVLAVLFQKYSIELAVDEWATDDEVAAMSDEQKKEVYAKAQSKARRMFKDEMSTRITLKLHGDPDYIPIRIVRKGEERFLQLIE